MTVEWNGDAFKLAMRQAVAKGLTEAALAAEGIARNRTPRAYVIRVTKGKGTPVYATPSSNPTGYPARRTASMLDAYTTSIATPDNLRAAFGIFNGEKGPRKFILNGSGADGYPKFLEFKPISQGGRRWARRTISENQRLLSTRFTQAAQSEFKKVAPR